MARISKPKLHPDVGTRLGFMTDVMTSMNQAKRLGITNSHGFMELAGKMNGYIEAASHLMLTSPPSYNAWWMRFQGFPELTLEALVQRHHKLFTKEVVQAAIDREAKLMQRSTAPAR